MPTLDLNLTKSNLPATPDLFFSPDSVVERRDGERRLADLPAKLCDESGARFYAARVRDVSPQGLRLIVPPNFRPAPGAELRLQVEGDCEGVVNRALMRPVRVCWRMPLESEVGQAIGVQRLDPTLTQQPAARLAA